MNKFLLTNGMKIGNATVIVDIIPKGNTEIRPGTKMTPKYITEHNTGNPGKGANAEAHNRYMHNMAKKDPRDTTHISWHLTIDEHFIYQHIPFDEMAFHCGDGYGAGNSSSIGLEICMHLDQKNYMQAEQNAVALTAHLMKLFNIPLANVRPHKDWSGKNCPQIILERDGSLNKFRERVQVIYQGSTSPSTNTPTNISTVYTVVKGDTLSKIAANYNTTVPVLLMLNDLANANKIYVGQKLIIKPQVEEAEVKPVKEDKQKEVSNVGAFLNDTGRAEIRELLKRARDEGVIDKAFHTNAKIDNYSDTELLSYQAAVVNRTFKKIK